ncbi:MAG: ATP-binding protein [Deltaproteobacteria bacterium]|nr:ATP-binding protein [Deltaproteobacteria bacterium]
MRARAAASAAAVVEPASIEVDALRQGYARDTAATVRQQLPWAIGAFLLTYAAVALFEVQLHPERLATYLTVYGVGVVWCGATIWLTRGPDVTPRRCLVVTTLLGVALIANTTTYHILVRGEAEVLALGNLYLVIGFLTAFPWGGWPQAAVAGAACAGLGIGILTSVTTAVSAGVLMSGMLSLGGLSVAAALLTDRYRLSLFHARDELRQAKEAAEAASRARRDFVASVSHDLRTPVNIIFGMADMALDVAVTAEQRDFVETIKRSASQLNGLLTDLLDFSKMDAGVVDLRPRRFALRPWLATALEAHGRDAAVKGVRLREEVAPGLPDALVGDPDRLRQVLANLVGNAVKFTDRGSIVVRLAAAGGGEAGVVLRCEVADTGLGIPAEETERLFQPFAQVPATTRSHAGTGLGLAICKRLVEQMGGRIGVDSQPGRGSTFWFTVPMGR